MKKMKKFGDMHIPIPETYNIEAMKEEAETILNATTKAVTKMKPNRAFSKGDAIELRRLMFAPGPVCFVPSDEDNEVTFHGGRVNIVYGTEPPKFAMIAYRNAPPNDVLTIYTVMRCAKRPPYVLPQGSGWFYVLSRYGNYKDSYACGNEYIVNIDEHGVITPAKFISESINYVGKEKRRVPTHHVLDYTKVYLATESYLLDKPESEIMSLTGIVALVFNIYSNTAYGWEIQFSKQEGYRGQVRFSFHLGVAKKLFRSRENKKPTPTGRLSPIAHFVKSHYREQKPKTLWQKFEYFVLRKRSFSTVKTHLRGATEFYMDSLIVRIKESNLDKDANPKLFFGSHAKELKEIQVLEDLALPASSKHTKDPYVYHVHTEVEAA
jgi:hypothetical protein